MPVSRYRSLPVVYGHETAQNRHRTAIMNAPDRAAIQPSGRPAGHPIKWDGPDADGWSWAGTPGGGVLIVKPRASGGWVPVMTTSDGFILWHGREPTRTREAAQRLCEQQAGAGSQGPLAGKDGQP
jgi:hypothetical protein